LKDLKLGYSTGYWPPTGPPHGVAEAVAEADRLGFHSVWTAESYGSDAVSPLAWWGSSTTNVQLGTSIIQMSGRTPAMTAMTAMTLDHLSGGRFICGLGVSGPQVVEGWYGQPFRRPLSRTREYIAILRAIWARQGPVTAPGPQLPLPYTGGPGQPEPTGLGKSIKANLRPLRADIPIYLGAEGPKNIGLAAELCDGWLPLFYSPNHEEFYRGALDAGFAIDGARRTRETFEIAAPVPLIITDDVEAAADFLRPTYALYFGGMGAKNTNFHADVAIRMGYGAEVDQITDLYLEGKKDEAAALVPTRLVEQLALIGPLDKVRHDLEAWRDSQVTTLLIGGDVALVRTAAELVLG